MKILNKYGYTKVEVIIVIVLLGIVSFVTINKTSYAFSVDSTDAVEEVINLIEMQAEEYASKNIEIFNETNITYISVNDLINSNYLIANDKGLITDPSNINKSFNDNKIKLEYNNEKVTATLIK